MGVSPRRTNGRHRGGEITAPDELARVLTATTAQEAMVGLSSAALAGYSPKRAAALSVERVPSSM